MNENLSETLGEGQLDIAYNVKRIEKRIDTELPREKEVVGERLTKVERSMKRDRRTIIIIIMIKRRSTFVARWVSH